MKKLLKEPLLHFLVIGALLFLVFGVLNPSQKENEIVIDDALVSELAAKWELTRDRQPTFEEVHGLIGQYIEQEVLYQEALAMNLDHNDEIVKRRLAQKMEFLSDGLAESLQPTSEILQDYYEKRKSNYQKPPVYTMELVYFSNDDQIKSTNDALVALKTQNPQVLGENISLPSKYSEQNATIIARDYGSNFVKALDSIPINKWAGPLVSGYGIHLVNISKKEASRYYSYDEVAEKVRVNYNYDTSNDFKKELITNLLKNYKVKFELIDMRLKKELDEKF